jgi:DNA polymerase elongation subunit (family B)
MIRFQIVSWLDGDILASDLSSKEANMLHPEVTDEHKVSDSKKSESKSKSEEEYYTRKHYSASVFGRCDDGSSISLRLLGFTPFVFVRVGDGKYSLGKREIYSILSAARECSHPRQTISSSVVSMTEYYGFSNHEKRDFAKISFLTKSAMRSSCSEADYDGKPKESLWSKTIMCMRKKTRLFPYEAHIEPIIRLIHILKIDASGWVEFDASKAVASNWANSKYTYSIRYHDLSPCSSKGEEDLAPITCMSYDLECVSRNRSDFPKPQQSYCKTASDIHDVHDRAVSKKWNRSATRLLIQACIFKALNVAMKGDVLSSFELAIKEKIASECDMSPIFAKDRVSASNLTDITRDISEDVDDFLRHDYTYSLDSCRSSKTDRVSSLLNLKLPPLLGDEIVQIGATFNIVGNETCSYKWIGTLGSCSGVEDTDVRQFSTETGLLLGFKDMVISTDPDIYIGYNVWGFDQNYLYYRAVELGIEKEFMFLSRVKAKPAYYEEKQLSSAAMGSNHNMLLTIPGRVNVDLLHVMRKEFKFSSYSLNSVSKSILKDEKDDVSAHQLFKLQDGCAEDRAIIAKYCIQDCALVTRLTERLTVIINAIAMANVCSVPLQYIFSRGQGIKCTSQVARVCMERGYIMKTHRKNDDEKIYYDGALVLEPKTGLYDRPVFCLDYASLYPSCMISHNICATSKVTDPKYLGIKGMKYNEVSFNVYKDKKVVEVRTVYYAQPESGELAVLPSIEETLKRKRTETRSKMKWKRVKLVNGDELVGSVRKTSSGIKIDNKDISSSDICSIDDYFTEFQKSVLNGQQLAYKVTGNSLYGAQGASTSDIRDVDCAASITSVGRSLIETAEKFLISEGCNVIYGDTDSCFATTPVFDDEGNEVIGPESVPLVIKKAKELEKKFVSLLPSPHVCEYEKIYYPWVLLSKKRYLGYKYEDADDIPKFSYNGIVLVRRDNCEALKDVVSDLCKHILALDIPGAIDGLRKSIDDLVEGRIPLEKLTITKSLGDSYKNPEQIAHWVLAQRIGRRDPARKPRSNDRIAYAFVTNKNAKCLQGDRIETPEFILENRLEIDYSFYLEHQVITPVCQILAAAVERVPGYKLASDHWDRLREVYYNNSIKKFKGDVGEAVSEARKLIDTEKAKYVKRLIFDPMLIRLSNKTKKQMEITSFFGPKK